MIRNKPKTMFKEHKAKEYWCQDKAATNLSPDSTSSNKREVYNFYFNVSLNKVP